MENTVKSPSQGRRSVRRAHTRNKLFSRAVKVFVAILSLCGPSETVSNASYDNKLGKAHRLQRKLTYRNNNSTVQSQAVGFHSLPPPWACDLYLSSRTEGKELKESFDECMKNCRLSRCTLPPNGEEGSETHIETAQTGDYSISKMQKSALYEAIDIVRLDIPEPGFRQMPVANFLKAWPWCELFSPDGVAALRKPPAELLADPPPKSRLHLLKPEEYPELVRKLHASGLLELHTLEQTRGLPDNGLFALVKPNGKQRLIVDEQPGNHMDRGMKELQRRYTALITAFPERAKVLGLPDRVMEICSPSDIANLPSGGVSKTVSDFSNYFHQLLALPGSKSGQCLPAVDLGYGFVRPVYRTLPMGHWLAALLSHLAHKHMMQPMVDRPLIFRKPEYADTHHRTVCEKLNTLKDDNGLVSLADLPPGMLSAFTQAAGVPTEQLSPAWLDKFACPMTALTLQPAEPSDPPEQCITIATHILGDAGFDSALAISRTRERADEGGREHFDVCALVYIDDSHNVLYPPLRTPERSLRLRAVIGDAQRLAACFHAARHGCELNTGKLKWTSSDATPTLGVEIGFHPREPGWPMRVAVSPLSRATTEAQIRSLLAGCYTHITEDYFDHIMGKLVWDVLVRRPFLSVFDLVFRARHSKHRPHGLVWLSSRLKQELALLADLMPLFTHRSKPLSTRMYIFDASGVNAIGNGGYGVVHRDGVTPAIVAEIMGTAYNRLPLYRIGDDGSPPSDTPAAVHATDFILQDWASRRPDWKVVRSGEFVRPPPHVNIAEASTGGMTIRAAARSGVAGGHRILIGGDNTASLCALRKGRSSSFRLNGTCRRVAALTYLHDFDAIWFWLPSKANPADMPSRWWMRGTNAPQLRDQRSRRGGAPLFGSEYSSDCTGDGPPTFSKPPRIQFPKSRRAQPRHPYKGDKVYVSNEAPAHLASFSVKPTSLSGYLSGWSGFSRYLAATLSQHADFASALESYVEMAWESGGSITNGDCSNLLVGLAFVMPELKAQGTLQLAWRAMAGWAKLVPRESWNPISWNLLLFFAVLLAWNGEIDAAIALILSHHTYGRGGEINDLQDVHVALPGDPRCLDGSHGSVLFFSPKAGKMQTVELDDLLVIQLLAYQRRRNLNRPGRHGRFFPDLPKRGKFSLLERFKRVQVAAGFPEPLWVRHSCRHGGATRDYVTKRRLVPDIMVRGRWSSQKVCESYLNGAQAQYLSLSFPDIVCRRMADMGNPEAALRAALGLF